MLRMLNLLVFVTRNSYQAMTKSEFWTISNWKDTWKSAATLHQKGWTTGSLKARNLKRYEEIKANGETILELHKGVWREACDHAFFFRRKNKLYNENLGS